MPVKRAEWARLVLLLVRDSQSLWRSDLVAPLCVHKRKPVKNNKIARLKGIRAYD